MSVKDDLSGAAGQALALVLEMADASDKPMRGAGIPHNAYVRACRIAGQALGFVGPEARLVPTILTEEMRENSGAWGLRMTAEEMQELWADWLSHAPGQSAWRGGVGDRDQSPSAREVIRKALYEGLTWFGTLPEPQGDVPERYHRWDDLGELADRILAALTLPAAAPTKGAAL